MIIRNTILAMTGAAMLAMACDISLSSTVNGIALAAVLPFVWDTYKGIKEGNADM